jgi:hypothetical protein
MIFITLGSIGVLISFFGCCGSWFENRCCLIIVIKYSNYNQGQIKFNKLPIFLVLLVNNPPLPESVHSWSHGFCL